MKQYKLKEVASLYAGYPFDGHLYDNEGIRVVRGDNVTIGSLRWDIDKRWNLPFKEAETYSLRDGDIVIGMDGSRVGRNRAMVSVSDLPLYLAQRVACVRNREMSYQKYLYYAIFNSRFEQYINTIHTGTSIPHISLEQLGDFTFPMPGLNAQIKIGDFLYLLDKKIALNTRMNAELEAIAKQLYDYWFVQFDFPDENGNPYKSSGGKMVYNPTLKREIPAGWEVNTINNIIEPIERGISYSSEDIKNQTGIPMVNLACYSKQGEYRPGELKVYSGNYKSENITYPYDMLIACTDMTQDADIIGRPILVTEEYKSYVYSMDLIKITSRDIDKFYLYYSLRTPFYHKYIKPFASGTNVKHLKVDGITNYSISIPPSGLQFLFGDFIYNLKKREMKVINENKNLTHLRDSLLPMLMNGQVTVED